MVCSSYLVPKRLLTRILKGEEGKPDNPPFVAIAMALRERDPRLEGFHEQEAEWLVPEPVVATLLQPVRYLPFTVNEIFEA